VHPEGFDIAKPALEEVEVSGNISRGSIKEIFSVPAIDERL
jgi:hypothetical protein